MPINKVGNLLKEERIKRKMSLETLSELSDISMTTLSKIENNKLRKINSVLIFRICKILNVDYEFVIRQRWDILPVFLYERKSS